MISFLTDLFDRRGEPGGGFENARFLELHGATIIEPTAFEPDPVTHHHEYYYNAITNRLYRRVISRDGAVKTAHWQGVSQ